jgi:FKBP-type peptidyl-prolyl cis-trans isomerase (trigger factor)
MPKFKITYKKETIEEVEVEVEEASIMEALDNSRARAKKITAHEPNVSGKTTWTVCKVNQIGE